MGRKKGAKGKGGGNKQQQQQQSSEEPDKSLGEPVPQPVPGSSQRTVPDTALEKHKGSKGKGKGDKQQQRKQSFQEPDTSLGEPSSQPHQVPDPSQGTVPDTALEEHIEYSEKRLQSLQLKQSHESSQYQPVPSSSHASISQQPLLPLSADSEPEHLGKGKGRRQVGDGRGDEYVQSREGTRQQQKRRGKGRGGEQVEDRQGDEHEQSRQGIQQQNVFPSGARDSPMQRQDFPQLTLFSPPQQQQQPVSSSSSPGYQQPKAQKGWGDLQNQSGKQPPLLQQQQPVSSSSSPDYQQPKAKKGWGDQQNQGGKQPPLLQQQQPVSSSSAPGYQQPKTKKAWGDQHSQGGKQPLLLQQQQPVSSSAPGYQQPKAKKGWGDQQNQGGKQPPLLQQQRPLFQQQPPSLQQQQPVSSSSAPGFQQPKARKGWGELQSQGGKQPLSLQEQQPVSSSSAAPGYQQAKKAWGDQGGKQPHLLQQQQPVSSSSAAPGYQQAKKAWGDKQSQDGKQPPLSQQQYQSSQKQSPIKPDVVETPKKPSLSDLAIPRRKKLKSAGTQGRRLIVETNHLELSIKKFDEIIHYDVTIEPDMPKKLFRMIMEEFRLINYSNRYPAFDGKKNLYSSRHLPFGNQINGEVEIEDNGRTKMFKVAIKYASVVDLSLVTQYFMSQAEGNSYMVPPQEAIQCIDVVLRNAPSLQCIPFGRSFFTKPQGCILPIGGGMEMYYGFYQSAILGWKPYLNVDVAHKPFPKVLKIIDLITELCECDLKRELDNEHFDTVNKFIRDLKIHYEVPGNPTSKRIQRVNGLDKPASFAKFTQDDGNLVTVEQYFKQTKSYQLQYPRMPCLWVGNKTKTPKLLYPAELCTLIEGQVVNKPLTPEQTSSMIKIAATSTRERKQKIMSSVTQAKFNHDPTAYKEFGIFVREEFTRVPARVLDAPPLNYAFRKVTPSKGVWKAEQFVKGKSLQKWAILNIDYRTRQPALQEFAEMMIKQGGALGMQISRPEICSLKLSYNQPKRELENQFQKLKGMELIVVIISDDKQSYNYVKQVAELTVGALTQCVRGKNVFRPKPATIGNILLKINAKLNGINHILADRPKCLEKPCMIMGADVTHPGRETRGSVPSVAAVTASHDPQAFQYNICWRLQPPTQEIIDDLANIVKQHLLFFYKKNRQQKPERIIFFRDGVSEGQFQSVLNAEIKTIRQACTMLQPDGYNPKITFLVVQKRHHTRFFPTNPRDSEDRNCNVPAGTIVDTEITHPTALDFYLVSHASIQGVARPTKYRILWDDCDMNEDEVELLTYHLCHLYTRCTRSVSYPAPTYYAHLAAARAKVYCEQRHINMDNLKYEQDQIIIKPEVVEGLPMFFV